MKTSFDFRVLKSSWGISIKIIGDIENEKKRGSIKLSNLLYLEENLAWLSTEERVYLLKGLDSLRSEIKLKLKNEDFIKLYDIEFNYCDFQPEGLFCAMAGWVANRLELPLLSHDVCFDQSKNIYIFNFT